MLSRALPCSNVLRPYGVSSWYRILKISIKEKAVGLKYVSVGHRPTVDLIPVMWIRDFSIIIHLILLIFHIFVCLFRLNSINGMVIVRCILPPNPPRGA
jgi:hypothetical protein